MDVDFRNRDVRDYNRIAIGLDGLGFAQGTG
jgi:hypothetical protein